MKVHLIRVISLLLLIQSSDQFEEPSDAKRKTPLILTDYIDSGDLEGARTESKVDFLYNIESYAGFFKVNNTSICNMFFWFFPSERDPNDPLILWLQGGPGYSSMHGIFFENGPYSLTPDGQIKHREYYWSQRFNVLYIDNPVGTGFSYCLDSVGYAQNQTVVGEGLYKVLKQFFTIFNTYTNNDFYIAGESYGGKFASSLGYTIHNNNKESQVKINMKGLLIGNGFCDPENMLIYGDYLYQIGLIDDSARVIFQEKQAEIKKFIQAEEYDDALDINDELITGIFYEYNTFLHNLTGIMNIFNYISFQADTSPALLYNCFNNNTILEKIHVGNISFQFDLDVVTYMKNDLMRSVKPWIQILLEEYKFLFYNGQLDVIVPYTSTVNFIRKLEWSQAEEYKQAQRVFWMVGETIAGYSKSVKGLTEVMVRNAGHSVPEDQPLWALELISNFIEGKFHEETT